MIGAKPVFASDLKDATEKPKTFSQNLGNFLLCHCVVIEGEKQKLTAFRIAKPRFAQPEGGEKMKPLPSDLVNEQRFDSYVKKTLKFAARNHYKKTKDRLAREVYFSELTSEQYMKLAATDEYFDGCSFNVLGWAINVSDPELAEALEVLPSDLRDVILLYYFIGMPDREIGEHLRLANSTVAYRRTSTLGKLKRIMEENADEQQKEE
jgi:DNA-directed RNA polymerase specialized sigma24 family protein